MRNTDNPGNRREQLATILTDYRALLAMTRPLVIAEHSLPSWRGGETGRSGFGIFPEPADWRAEYTVRRGEIFRSDEAGPGMTENEEPITTAEEAAGSCATEVEDAAMKSVPPLGRRNSELRIRVYLGMS